MKIIVKKCQEPLGLTKLYYFNGIRDMILDFYFENIIVLLVLRRFKMYTNNQLVKVRARNENEFDQVGDN